MGVTATSFAKIPAMLKLFSWIEWKGPRGKLSCQEEKRGIFSLRPRVRLHVKLLMLQ